MRFPWASTPTPERQTEGRGGIQQAEGVVRLGSEVDDGVDVLALERSGGRVVIADVALDEGDHVADVREVLDVARVREEVVHDHVIVGGDRYVSFAESGLL